MNDEGYSISFGPYLKADADELEEMLALAREAMPAKPNEAYLAVLRKAEAGSVRHLQALLSAKEGNPYALNRRVEEEARAILRANVRRDVERILDEEQEAQ